MPEAPAVLKTKNLLLLAGTGEADPLSREIDRRKEWSAIASIEGGARIPKGLSLTTRTGGFGGDSGFKKFLQDNEINAVLDATHPFADRVSNRSARICKDLSIPYLFLSRPAWSIEDYGPWHDISNEADAARVIPVGSRVFVATGRKGLEDYAALKECTVICRQINTAPDDFPLANGWFEVDSPPFSIEDERATFKRLNIDWLVLRNAGGARSVSKIIAAQELGINIAMIQRPAPPNAPNAPTIEEALAWLDSL